MIIKSTTIVTNFLLSLWIDGSQLVNVSELSNFQI
jgi:hypothetical protein